MGLNDFYSALDQHTENDTQRKQAEAVYNLNNSYKVNPDEEAEKRRLEQSTGIPATLMSDPQVKESAKQQYYMQGLAISHTPSVANFAANANNAPLMKDDVHNLTAFEGAFKTLWNDVIKPTPARAWSAYQQGVGGMYQWVGEAAVQPVINAFTSEETRKKYGTSNMLTNLGVGLRNDAKFVDEYLRKEHPLDPNSWAGASASALQSMYLQAPFMAIGSLAGTAKNATAATLGLMGLTTGGQTYGERRDRGFSPAASGMSAAWDASVEVGTELMPMGTLFQMMKPAEKYTIAKMGAKLVELYGEEMVGESLATLFQDLNDKFMTKPDMTMKERVNQIGQYFSSGEAVQNWVNTLKSTAVQTTVMGGAGAGINRLHQGRVAREQAQHDAVLEALTTAEMSKLKDRSPDTFAQFAQNTAEHYGAPTIYFQADKLITAAINNGVTEQQLPAYLEQYGVTPSSLQEALHTGGLIGLETGKFATYFQNDPVLQSLQNDFVIDPSAHSRSEAENGVQLDMETMKHLNELYQADQNHKINQDDIAAWEEAVLSTPGLKGRVTIDSLMPLIARSNVLAQLTGAPAIEHLNRMMQPTGLQAMKFAEYEARKQNKAANAKYDFDIIYDSLLDEGNKTVIKGKGNKGNWSESEFSKHLEQFYPAVHSLYLMHGHNKSQILAALKNAKEGKQLNDNHAAIVQTFKEDLDNYAEQQVEDDYPFQRDYAQAEKATTHLPSGTTHIDVDGVQRHALNSNGQPIHWSEEGIRNFWRWFGDSKVVDEQGRPLVVYHGTNSDFSSFKLGQMFTTRPIEASGYAEIRQATGNGSAVVYPVYLNISDPAYFNRLNDGDITDFYNDMGDHDGVITDDGHFVSEEPTQIKSATGNSGAFNPSEPSILFQSAWHGSPHTFDKFSTSAIGTGEGAQAYGWGMYFAGNKEVAEWYKNKLSNSKVLYKDQDYQAISKELPQEAYSALAVVQTYGSIDAAIESIRNRKGETAAKIADWLENNREDVTFDNNGRLYKVELAPAEDEYLLWHKPLSEQSEKVREALSNINADKLYNLGIDSKDGVFVDAYNGKELSGEQLNKYLSNQNGAKAASEYLHSLGIRGIKYLDGNSRNRPLKDIKKAFLSAIPEDAEFSDVMELVGTGKFSQEQESLLKALEADDWLGFDYPAQAISAALGNGLNGFDPSKTLSAAVAELAKDQQFNYVIFHDDDVAIQEMYQKQQANNNPLGALNTANGVNLVSLFEGADKSTFLHETAHIFLNDLCYVAETYGVQQKEWEEVKAWLGIGEDNQIAREQHEMFAEHFEKYLMEGKAPSLELRNAFRSFKRWLTKIYEGIKSYRKGQRDNITINPELSALFDRLIATEQQIQQAREHDALVGMLDANMMADVGDSQSMIDEYRKLLAQSDDSAREKMDKHKLVGSEQRKTEFRKQAQEEVKDIPVYAFVDKVVAEGGISRQSVEAILGKENTPNLPHLWRNDGLDVNVAVAEHGAEHGFNSAGDLAAALQQMEPRQLWVDKRVAQLEAIHDASLDSQEAIRTAALRRMLEIESEWLAKRAVKQTVTPRAAMRAWADKTIAGRTMREINNVGKLLAESRKHRQQAILEARQGKWEEALAANEKARLTEELIAASYRAIKANKAIESNVNKVKNATKVKSGEPAKVGESWRKQIDRLLDQYGIAKREYDPAAPDLHSFAASKIDDFDGTGAALPSWIGVEVSDFNKLTFEQRQEFNDALKYLYGNGRDEVRGRKLASGEAAADKAAEIAARQDGIKNKPELMSDATAAGRVIQKVQKNYRKFFANTGILRFIAKRMDGYSKDIGPAEQLVQDIINGMAASNDMWVAIQKEVEPALQILMKDGDKVFSDITWPELLRNEGASWNKSRVVAAALNMGNDSNMMKLLDGYGLNQADASNIASKLTAEEWQAIQKIWDTVDSLWPQIADVHERLKYFRPKKIEARPLTITTADGQQITLKGGYYPIKYDSRFTRKIAEWSEKDDLLASHEAIMNVPAAKSGFSKERTGVAYPVDLSLNVLAGHFNDTIRFITLAEKVRDADRVFRNDVLMERNLETMGRDMVDMIRPTLKQVIRPEASKVSPWFERSRVAMSMYYMGYNAWIAIQNVTGVFPAIRQAGAANYMNGIMHVIANPLAAHKAMLEASAYMRLRAANVERDMKKQLREFNIGGMEINGNRYTYDDVKSLGFAGIRLIDGIVALPAWWGKYNAEMEQHGDVKKATEAADAAINSALGSGLAIDSTGFGRHPFLSLLAPFMSFASTQQEVLATERQAWKEGKIGNSEFLYGHLMTWVAPAIMSTFLQGMLMYGIAGALGGGDDDKKKKDWSDYIGDLISYRLMGIPFLRDVYNGVKQGVDNKAPVTSARMPVTEGFKMVQQLGYRVGNLDGSEKKTKAAMWSAAELASLASGIPATRIYERWQKGTKQIENGTGWWGNHFVPQEKKK